MHIGPNVVLLMSALYAMNVIQCVGSYVNNSQKSFKGFKDGRRIMGGQATSIRMNYPYFARVFSTSTEIQNDGLGEVSLMRCGGSLLQLEWILTANHCLGKKTFVALGTEEFLEPVTNDQGEIIHWTISKFKFDRYVYPVGLIISKPGFNEWDDLALLRLHPSRRYGVYSTLHLPLPNEYNAHYPRADFIGFGYTGIPYSIQNIPKVLQKITLNVQDERYCRLSSAQYNHRYMMCHSNLELSGVMPGDSGGPVIVRGKHGRQLLIGVIIQHQIAPWYYKGGSTPIQILTSFSIRMEQTAIEWITTTMRGNRYRKV